MTSCYGRTHPALHHVAIHITRPHPGMAPGPVGFCFASSPNSNAHRPSRPWGRVSRMTLDVPGRPSHALANCNACHPTISQAPQRAPCRLIQERTACCPRQVRSVMACNGGLHSLVAAASLFAHSLAAVSNKPVHVPPWDAACSCLATKAYDSHPIPGRYGPTR